VKTDSFLQPAADRIPAPVQLTNVYAVLKGADPANASRVVLVTGHYDSRNSDTFDAKGDAPGANDDASGTAVSLECARVLSQMSVEHKFPATIIFLTVAGEEQGLNGSDHFAKFMREQEKGGTWTLEAVLNNDIVGGDKSPGQRPEVVRVFSEGLPSAADDKQVARIRGLGGESDSPSRELARAVAEVGRAYRVGTQPEMVFRLDRYLRGGDHYSFNKQGFAAVRFTEYHENYDRQHQNVRTEKSVVYGDTPDHVDFEYVSRVAKLNAATLASLALAPAPPANVKLLTKELDNNSELKWDAAPGSLAASYEVLWRATSSPDWEHAKSAGNATKITMPISKDNVIFAVRAVGKDGQKSLPVVPVPER
jgi:Zn-dependent M28 family amino/carboxypeptidase